MNILEMTLKTFSDSTTDYAVVELCVDGSPIVDFHYYATDLEQLMRSVTEAGEFFILTCWCGVPECASIGHGVDVLHEKEYFRWHISQPLPQREFIFIREAVQNALTALKKDIKRFVAERIYSDETTYEVTPMQNEAYFNLD